MSSNQIFNLLRGTRDLSGCWYATKYNSVIHDDGNCFAVAKMLPVATVCGVIFETQDIPESERVDEPICTLSFMARADVAGDRVHAEVWGSKYLEDFTLTTEWQIFSMPYGFVNAKMPNVYFNGIIGNSGAVYMALPMAVRGTTPAAWAPAEGEILAGRGALMSANLLDGLTPTLFSGTTESDGIYHHAARTDTSEHDDWLMYNLPEQPALATNQTYHVGLSTRGASANSASLHATIGYKDAAGNVKWANSHPLPIGTSWGRTEATIVVPSGMTPFAFYVAAYGTCPETWMASPTLSYGTSGPILASDSHTPYATQEHIVELYATKASLEVTNNSIKSEVSERTTLANTVSSLSSSLNATDQNVSNLQSGLATTNSNLATTNSNLSTANTNISNLENSIANTNKKVQTNTSSISQLSSSIVSAVKGESTYTDPYGNTVTNTLASKIEQTSTNLTLKFNNYTTTSDMNDAIATAKSEATSAANSNTASKLVDYTKTNDLASTAAVKDAKKAGTDAATAASEAQSKAKKAQTTANTAVSNAAAAQQSANNAQTTASEAQSKANNLMTMIRASEAGIEIGKSSDGTTFTTTRTKIDEDSFDILDKNGNVLNTFEKTGQTLYVEGVDNFSVRSDPNYQTYVYTDARRFTIDSKNRVITYGVYGIDLTLAANAILGMYVCTESGMDTEDLKSRITSTVKHTDLPSHTGRPGLTGTIITVSYNPSSSTDKITKYGTNRVSLKIKSTGKILVLNFGTSNSHVGYGSMTLGYGNLATGAYSTAFGVNTESHGDNSVSMGTGTYAMRSNSLAVGIYNDPRNNTLFSVGNGTDQDNRSNAFWVNDDGAAKAASFISSRGLGTSGTLDVQGHSTLNTLLVANNFSANSTANITGTLTAGSIKTSGSLSSGPITSGAITSGDISSGALTIHGSRKIDGIWEGSKVLMSAGQSTAFMSASEFQTITGYSLSRAQTDWALIASNGDWNALSGINFTLGWTSNYINIATNPSTTKNMRVNYTFIKFA